MKSIVIPAPGEVTLVSRPEPEPAWGEVKIRIRRAGFCGTDLSTFRGVNPLVTYPRTPGHELAGVVHSVGPGVPANWRPGLPVLVLPYTSCGRCAACRQGRENCCRHNQTLGVQREGGMSEYLCLPWQKIMTAPGLDFARMALVEPLTVGFHAVSRGRVAAGETVVVLGCGAIGLGAISGAAARGARVVAVDLDDDKLALATQAGAAHGIHSGREDLSEKVLDMTGGEGAEVVIEAIGNPATFRLAVDLACFAGRVVYIGYAKALVEYETKYFVQKELDILGSRNATPGDFEQVVGMLSRGQFPVDGVITQTVDLADAPEALRKWSDNPLSITKIQVAFGCG